MALDVATTLVAIGSAYAVGVALGNAGQPIAVQVFAGIAIGFCVGIARRLL